MNGLRIGTIPLVFASLALLASGGSARAATIIGSVESGSGYGGTYSSIGGAGSIDFTLPTWTALPGSGTGTFLNATGGDVANLTETAGTWSATTPAFTVDIPSGTFDFQATSISVTITNPASGIEDLTVSEQGTFTPTTPGFSPDYVSDVVFTDELSGGNIRDGQFVADAVPEPASLALLGGALFGFGAMMRWRRRGRKA